MNLQSLHTVRFSELCQNPFVTKVARTLRTLRTVSHCVSTSKLQRTTWTGFGDIATQTSGGPHNYAQCQGPEETKVPSKPCSYKFVP